MTIKDRINELLSTASAADIAPAERADLIGQARDLCREHKIGMGGFDWPDEEKQDAEAAGSPETPVSRNVAAPPAGGPIGQMVEELLLDADLSYGEIARRVRERFTHARTSNRSVASTAKAMRLRGIDVAARRAPRQTTANKESE